MKTANVWGQGQIFAFSALDGNNFEKKTILSALLWAIRSE